MKRFEELPNLITCLRVTNLKLLVAIFKAVKPGMIMKLCSIVFTDPDSCLSVRTVNQIYVTILFFYKS